MASRLAFGPQVVETVPGVRFLVRRGMTGITGSVYCGLDTPDDMLFMLHLLRSGDSLIDAGANVGSYGVLGSVLTGSSLLAVEPVVSTARALEDNIRLNRIEARCRIERVALGAEDGEILMSSDVGVFNAVRKPGTAATERDVKVPLRRLDGLVEGSPFVFMKMDLEGFELPALRGAARLLGDRRLLGIVIELNGLSSRYGHSDAEVDAILRAAGFVSGTYDGKSRTLRPREGYGRDGNTLYFRSDAEVEQRLRSAPSISLGWTSF